MKIMLTDRKPFWTHDCAACEYLCTVNDSVIARTVDYYICRTEFLDTIVIRYGNGGSNYYSTPVDNEVYSQAMNGFNADVILAARLAEVEPPTVLD
jgi:hypothetical protein